MDLDKYLDELLESYTSSTIKRNRGQKLKSTAGTIAISLARKKDDPLYKRMIFYKTMYVKTKKQLETKYKSKSNMLARQKASSYKKK